VLPPSPIARQPLVACIPARDRFVNLIAEAAADSAFRTDASASADLIFNRSRCNYDQIFIRLRKAISALSSRQLHLRNLADEHILARYWPGISNKFQARFRYHTISPTALSMGLNWILLYSIAEANRSSMCMSRFRVQTGFLIRFMLACDPEALAAPNTYSKIYDRVRNE
jgi:hypothetical protein